MIGRNTRPRSHGLSPRQEVTLSYESADWFRYTSERAARAAAWRRKLREKRRQRRDQQADH